MHVFASSKNMNNSNITFILFSLILLLPLPLASSSSQPHNISAVLAFGDSTLDSGNNNFIRTLVRANHTPYGRDFPNHLHTGRFSNGKLITDFLVSSLGLKQTLPASSDPNLTVADLLTGVSFASAGSGFDDLTAGTAGVVTMGSQVHNFEEYVGRLREGVGREKADGVVKSAVFVIGAGSNDLIMNYYLTPLRRVSFSVDEYHGFLLQKMESFVQRLYTLGARKFTISGLPPLGCVPIQMTINTVTALMKTGSFTRLLGPRVCIDQQNADSVSYNSRLQALINRMESSLEGTRFAYVDIYNPVMHMIKNPGEYGFTHTSIGCCGSGMIEMGPACNGGSCADPSKYLFWDSVHPSQATYRALSDQLMQSLLSQLTD